MRSQRVLGTQIGTGPPLGRFRLLSCSSRTGSGHNRWSKIKHDKAKEDALKGKARTKLSHEIFIASKFGGPEPAMNPRLAAAITAAKAGQLAKTSIEQAIARGQGKSTTGAPLEQVMIEAMFPSNVAAIIECHTESKPRTLQDVRMIVNRNGGSITTTSFFFEKKGKVWFQEKENLSTDDIMEEVIEAGATDYSTQEGQLVVETEPSDVMAVSERLRDRLQLVIERADIVYDAKKETAVSLTEEQEAELQKALEWLEGDVSVQNVYVNTA